MRSRRSGNSPTAILCADLHIRPDIPAGRIDDYQKAMFDKLSFIINLSIQYNCPIFVAGDLGNKPLNQGWPTWLLERVICILKESKHPFIVIPGQHDLPNHQLSEWKDSGIGVLASSGAITLIGPNNLQQFIEFDNFVIHAFPWSKQLQKIDSSLISSFFINTNIPQVAITHQMVIENKELWPDQNAPTGHKLLDEFPEYSLILSGDNHQSFVCEKDGRFLVNPGSMMRSTTAQQNHKPRVYLWYAEEKRVEPVYLPIKDNVFDLQYIEQQEHNKDKEQRFEALITRVKEDVEVELSFENNLQQYLNKNRTEKSVVDKIWQNVQ